MIIYIRRFCLFVCFLLSLGVSFAQESELLKKYRAEALRYNQDVQAAGKNILLHQELEKAARADYKPKLTAVGNFNYTGNPMELSLDLPALENPLYFKGRDMKYGASLSLTQSVYAGGRVRESVRMAQKQSNLSVNQSQVVKSDICYEADLRYWNVVARREIADVALLFRQSVDRLTAVVRERVEVELVSRNDLLMVEVKLNEADYQLIQAQNNYEVARMALNSFVGSNFEGMTPVDAAIPAIRETGTLVQQIADAKNNRAELRMAEDRIALQESALKLNDAQYLPQFHVGMDGSYSSPGYNFSPDLDPNYAIYAKISIPLFEWNKRGRGKKASAYRIAIARDNYSKVDDNIKLEVQSAWYSYSQSVVQVCLTENSLDKARENENMATENYREGKISIAEVLDAQLYHQTAQINYVQSRLNAQVCHSEFIRALGIYQF